MATSIKCIMFISGIFILMAFGSTGARTTGQEQSLPKKAAHHYKQLVATLIEMKERGVGNLSTILIAASGNRKNKNDEVSSLLLTSLLGSYPIVQNIKNGSVTNVIIFNNATVNFISREKKKKTHKSRRKDKGRDAESKTDVQLAKSSEKLSPWMKNLVRPLNVTTKREGGLVRVTFDVLRTEPAIVSHTWTFDGVRKYLKGPTDYDLDAGVPITSTIDFVFNASGCPQTRNSYHRIEHFAFSKKSINLDQVTLIMPMCMLDVMNGMREIEKKETNWNEPEDEYSQALHYPSFWNKMNTSVIRTVSGENVTFDIPIALGEQDEIMMEGRFHSHATSHSKIMLHTLFLRVSNGQIDIRSSDNSDMVKLLDVEVLNQTQINGLIPGIEYKALDNDTALDYYYHVVAKLRVTLLIADKDASGILNIQHECNLPFKRPDIFSIMALRVLKAVQILRPNQKEAIPKGKYITQIKKRFLCGKDIADFSHYQGHGDNCTFFCLIFGTDIRNIRVRKIRGGVTPVQKYAEVNSNNAMLFVNLGPSRREMDGEYECRVIRHGGTSHKWKVSVGTWGFPTLKEMTLDIQNESAMFVCVVASERSVNLYTSIHMESHRQSYRIDGRPDVTRSLHKHGNETRMEVTLPTSYLRWPNEFLACDVESLEFSDAFLTSLKTGRQAEYYNHTGHAFLLLNESSISHRNDGVVTVRCVAKGRDPLEINFYLNYQSGPEEIVKNNSMNTITTQRDGDKTITALKIPATSLRWPRHTISCRAQNEVGEDSVEYPLANIIRNYRSH